MYPEQSPKECLQTRLFFRKAIGISPIPQVTWELEWSQSHVTPQW